MASGPTLWNTTIALQNALFANMGTSERGVRESLEFWEVAVQWLYSRFGNLGKHANSGISGINNLSVFNASVRFDSSGRFRRTSC